MRTEKFEIKVTERCAPRLRFIAIERGMTVESYLTKSVEALAKLECSVPLEIGDGEKGKCSMGIDSRSSLSPFFRAFVEIVARRTGPIVSAGILEEAEAWVEQYSPDAGSI